MHVSIIRPPPSPQGGVGYVIDKPMGFAEHRPPMGFAEHRLMGFAEHSPPMGFAEHRPMGFAEHSPPMGAHPAHGSTARPWEHSPWGLQSTAHRTLIDLLFFRLDDVFNDVTITIAR